MSEYIVYEEKITGKKYKPGTVFDVSVLIPDKDGEFGLYIGHDARNKAEENALLRLADEGKAPYCVCIELAPGALPLGEGVRNMRLDDYDLWNSEYGDFIVYELIPAIAEKYDLRIDPSPDWHMTSGGSSGGISAFAIAWFHPDVFHRVYMSSPSFLAMGYGNEVPLLIRKYETKPFRVYEEYSEDEPDDYFGSSLCAAKEAETALRFAGYDLRCEYFPGESHCSRYQVETEAYKRLEWLWDGYASAPLRAPRNSPRVSLVVPDGSSWEKADEFPEGAGVTLSVASSDKTMIYSADAESNIIRKAPIGRGDAIYCHGMLHTLPQEEKKGAIDLAIDENDRLYVLTRIGVQCVRSFGLIDVILDLPGKSRPLSLSFGVSDRDMLYLRTEDGIYRRKTCSRGATDAVTEPKFIAYGD